MIKLLCSAGVAALLAASPADAATYLFSLAGPTTATFTLNSSPTPDNVSNGKGFFAVFNVAGIYNGVAGLMNIDFFLSFANGGVAQDGGVEFDMPGGNFTFVRGGPQLFTGDLATPTFKLGTFTLAADANQKAQTLTISAVPGVPEPATWAMMIGGFGMVGFAMRRRNVAVSFG